MKLSRLPLFIVPNVETVSKRLASLMLIQSMPSNQNFCLSTRLPICPVCVAFVTLFTAKECYEVSSSFCTRSLEVAKLCLICTLSQGAVVLIHPNMTTVPFFVCVCVRVLYTSSFLTPVAITLSATESISGVYFCPKRITLI